MLAQKGAQVATIAPDRPVTEALQTLQSWNVGALVVSHDGSHIAGMLSERDIVRQLAEHGDQILATPVALVMTEVICTCRPLDLADTLMAQMTELRLRHVPVVDERGALCGIISIGDVVKSRVNELMQSQEMLIDYVQGGR